MRITYKRLLWLVGFIIFISLILFPHQQIKSSWSTFATPLLGKTIVLDPGHGGPDGGAVGKDGTEEKDIALMIAKLLQEALEKSGATVLLTRNEDQDLASPSTKRIAQRKSEDIRKRVAFIEEQQADFFVSIHLNALQDKQWSGAQTFFYPRFPENKELAKSIQQELVHYLENTKRTALALDGVYLLKYTDVPGALVEVGFLSNDGELQLLKSQTYQKQVAESIFYGILRFEERLEDQQE